MNKEKRKELIEQKFKNKKELALAKAEFKKTFGNIKNQLIKAHLKERKIINELKAEKASLETSDKKERDKIKAETQKQRLIILENKKMLKDKKRILMQDIKLKSTEAKMKAAEVGGQVHGKMLGIKQEIREERLEQRRKLEELRDEIRKKRLDSNQIIAEVKTENITHLAKVKEELSEHEKEILNRKKELMQKRNEELMKAKSKRAVQIANAKKEKEELKLKKIEAFKDYRDHINKIRVNNLDLKEEQIIEINQLHEIVNKSHESLEETKTAIEKDMLETQTQLHQENIEDIKEFIDKNPLKIEKEEVEAIFEEEDELGTISAYNEISNLVTGQAMKQVGKVGIKLFEKSNRRSTDIDINKIKLRSEEIELVNEMIALKEANALTDVKEFIKYISFVIGKKIEKEQAETEIVSVIANLLMGKTLQALGGYIYLETTGRYKHLKFSKELISPEYNVISLPNTKGYKLLEKMLLAKLKKGLIVKIGNNTAIKSDENIIKIMHDLPFLR